MDADLRELERRWLASGAVEDGVACLRARLRAQAISEETLRLAAHLGHPAAVAALEAPAYLGLSEPDWLAGLRAYGVEAAAARRVVARLEDGIEALARPALRAFCAALDAWRPGEPGEALLAAARRVRPSTEPPSPGAFNPTGTSDDDDVHYSMSRWGAQNGVDLWDLWRTQDVGSACVGLARALTAPEGQSLGYALRTCWSLVREGRGELRREIQEELLRGLGLPFALGTLRDPTQRDPSVVAAEEEARRREAERQRRRAEAHSASNSNRGGLAPAQPRAEGSGLLGCVAFVAAVAVLVVFLATRPPSYQRPPLQAPPPRRPALPAGTHVLDLGATTITPGEASGLEASADGGPGFTLVGPRQGKPVQVRVPVGTVVVVGARRYMVSSPMVALLGPGASPTQGISAVSLEPDPWRAAPSSAAPLAAHPPQTPAEQRVHRLLLALREIQAAWAQEQAATYVVLHDPPDPRAGVEAFGPDRHGYLRDLPTRAQLKQMLLAVSVDPTPFRAFRR
ncbi:MAG: hypothetical protein AB7N76_14850 [Planctomycetota bacterium]